MRNGLPELFNLTQLDMLRTRDGKNKIWNKWEDESMFLVTKPNKDKSVYIVKHDGIGKTLEFLTSRKKCIYRIRTRCGNKKTKEKI